MHTGSLARSSCMIHAIKMAHSCDLAHSLYLASSVSSLLISEDIKHSSQEKRYYVLGRSDTGRTLFLVFTIRNNNIRIISGSGPKQKGKEDIWTTTLDQYHNLAVKMKNENSGQLMTQLSILTGAKRKEILLLCVLSLPPELFLSVYPNL